MASVELILKRLLDKMLPNREAPALGRVIKAHEGPGANRYSVDVRIVTAGTFEETGQVIAEAPISPIWVSRQGKGLYAIPPEDTLVIIEFIAWNPAYPYVSGIYSDEYNAGDFKQGQLMITDGKGLKFGVDVDSLFMFETKQQSLKKILDNMILVMSEIQTNGSPTQHAGFPTWVQKVLAMQNDVAALLK
jgi:hypothetical protein